MKMLSLFFLCLATTLIAEEPNAWLNKPIPQLVLTNGKTYTGVKITKIEADAISIIHSAGVARIPVESLTAESQEALGMDLEKAAEARKLAKAAADEAFAKQLATAAATRAPITEPQSEPKAGTFKVSHVLADEGGYLVYTYRRGGAPGRFASAMSTLSGRASTFIPAEEGDTPLLLRGDAGEGTVDDDIIDVTYQETGEIFQYETTLGDTKTVKILDLIERRPSP